MPALKCCISSTLITRLAVLVQWEGQHPKNGELSKASELKLWGGMGCSMCEGTRGESYPTGTTWTYKHIHRSESHLVLFLPTYPDLVTLIHSPSFSLWEDRLWGDGCVAHIHEKPCVCLCGEHSFTGWTLGCIQEKYPRITYIENNFLHSAEMQTLVRVFNKKTEGLILQYVKSFFHHFITFK